jgi:hypothetical protein
MKLPTNKHGKCVATFIITVHNIFRFVLLKIWIVQVIYRHENYASTSLASAAAQGNVVRAICISKGKAHF